MTSEEELVYRLSMDNKDFQKLKYMLNLNKKLIEKLNYDNKPKEEDESKRTEG